MASGFLSHGTLKDPGLLPGRGSRAGRDDVNTARRLGPAPERLAVGCMVSEPTSGRWSSHVLHQNLGGMARGSQVPATSAVSAVLIQQQMESLVELTESSHPQRFPFAVVTPPTTSSPPLFRLVPCERPVPSPFVGRNPSRPL